MSTTAATPTLELFADAVDTIRATEFPERPGEPRPSGYYGPLFAESGPQQRQAVEARIRYVQDCFRLAHLEPAGLDVLEAGSGFGIGLVTVACLGARSATGVELIGWQADWARTYLSRLPLEIAGRITVHTGSVTDMPVDDASADVIMSFEAISHYLDYKPFLSEAHRVLRPGGVLIVSDGNNGLNPRKRRATEQVWASHEVDPRTYVHDPADGEYNPWLLVDHRRRIILERQPGLDESGSWRLALETSGMIRPEIEAAADVFAETGETPGRPYVPGTLTVHPDHEMVMERLFDPWELSREIAGYGFRTRVRGHWAGASGKRWHRLADSALGACSPVTMRTSRGFRIAATKI